MSIFQKKSSSMEPGDVFISYRRCNADLVKPIENELQRRNISFFIDSVGVDFGMDYSGIIARAVKQCKVLLVIWTQEADDSPDMLREIKMAFDNGKIVVPYKVGTFNVTDHNAIYYQLSTVNRYEVPTQTPATIKELVNRIEKRLKENNTQPTPKQSSVSSQSNSGTTIPNTDIEDMIQEVVEIDFKNGDYDNAIKKLNSLLVLIPNSKAAKELLSICQSRLEVQKAESERKLREAEIELNRREEEVERKQREAEAERKRREQQLFLETLNRREVELERKQREIEAEQIRREQLRLEKECIIQEAEEQRKAEEAKHDLSVPGTDAGERKTFTVKGVEFAFRWCPDTITKGTLRQKNLQTKGFWMMETQVTQDQWAAVMGYNPSHFKGGNRPVEQVSWRECQVFCDKCKWLGLPVQLPTEAQWEYACLAGSPGEYAGILNEMAWYNSNSGRKTHPVQMKTPNAWGVYDMHGNVWEWCQDEQKQYGSQPYRGGSWGSAAKDCRSSSRRSRDSEDRDFTLGFRCVKNL